MWETNFIDSQMTVPYNKCFSQLKLKAKLCPNSHSVKQEQCPVGRMQKDVSTVTYDPMPFTRQEYQGSKFRMSMGLSPIPREQLIEIDEDYLEDMEERRKLLREYQSVVLHSTPQGTEANKELLQMLLEFLPEQFPDMFEKTDDGQFWNHATGDSWDLQDPSLDPLAVSAMLVQEDLTLLLKDEQGELKFVSGAVLFPQRWSLIEKIGMNMSRIHQPVPLYEKDISTPVNVFMERLEPSRPYARSNWTITDNFDKFQPLDEDALQIKMKAKADEVFANIEPVTSENAGTRICTRMERETLSRLPKTRAILFTIKTYIKPLERFKKDPEKARQLAKAIRVLDPSLAEYKTMDPIKNQALAFLDKLATSCRSKQTA